MQIISNSFYHAFTYTCRHSISTQKHLLMMESRFGTHVTLQINLDELPAKSTDQSTMSNTSAIISSWENSQMLLHSSFYTYNSIMHYIYYTFTIQQRLTLSLGVTISVQFLILSIIPFMVPSVKWSYFPAINYIPKLTNNILT